MAIIRPFRALRPVPEKAKDVSSVPYDVVNTDEARSLAERNPVSFLYVIRPEIDLPEGTALYEDRVYDKAAENLKKLTDNGVLVQDDEPCVYLYRLIMDGHEQVGVAACYSVDEYDNDTIRKHEHTRKEKEDDRLRHMLTLSAHTGPVLMTYRGTEKIDSFVSNETASDPLYDFTAPDGVRHTVWRVSMSKPIAEAFKEIPLLYIADGHHRAAGASRVKRTMVQKNPHSNGEEEFNYFLGVVFPAGQLKILSYNRYVKDLNGLSVDAFLSGVKKHFEITGEGSAEPREKGQFCMYLNKKWYSLRIVHQEKREAPDPVSSLELSIFQELLLEPLLGIKDQKKDKRIDFIGGAESSAKLEKRVDAQGGVAFTFYPVSVDELLAVADAGRIMPPKSTWFAPKLRSGLLIHGF